MTGGCLYPNAPLEGNIYLPTFALAFGHFSFTNIPKGSWTPILTRYDWMSRERLLDFITFFAPFEAEKVEDMQGLRVKKMFHVILIIPGLESG